AFRSRTSSGVEVPAAEHAEAGVHERSLTERPSRPMRLGTLPPNALNSGLSRSASRPAPSPEGGRAPRPLSRPAPAFQRALGLPTKGRRQELGLTQVPPANDTELHQCWISNVETGTRNPSYASLRHLAAGLDLATSQLIARAEE